MDLHFLSYIAAVLTTASTLPQIVKILKTRETKDLSLLTYTAMTLGVMLWAAYGFYLHEPALIIANIITLIFNFTILILIVINKVTKRKRPKVPGI